MSLHKWTTNSLGLQYQMNRNQNSTLVSGETKVLGVLWNTQDDTIHPNILSVVEFVGGKQNTKRFLLQASSRIFDPLGLLSPFVIRVKGLFQKIWEQNLG